MDLKQIENLLDQIIHIPNDRNYWLIRTMGGRYYNDFIERGFIAIAYDRIAQREISSALTMGPRRIETLTETVRSRYPQEFKPKYVAKQLINFTENIKQGDIVVIPSYNSASVQLGEVLDSEVREVNEVQNPNTPNQCTFVKRKSVRWMQGIPRWQLDPHLYKMLYSHHAVSDASSYGEYIDKTMYDFYIKNDTAHIILKVKTREEIKARELFRFGLDLLDDVDDFCNFAKIREDTSSIVLKTNLNSPGTIEFTGRRKVPVIAMAIVVLAINGGGLKVDSGDGVILDLSTKGLIQNVIDYQNSSAERSNKLEILQKHMKDLQIKTPDDLVKLLEQQNKKQDIPKQIEAPKPPPDKEHKEKDE